MGDSVTEGELERGVSAGSCAIQRAILVQHDDYSFCLFVRLSDAERWRRIVLAYRQGPRRRVDYRRAFRNLRERFGYRGCVRVHVHDDPLLPGMGIVP